MNIKLLCSFLLLVMAMPEAFANKPNRRGNSVRRGSATRSAPRTPSRNRVRSTPSRSRSRRSVTTRPRVNTRRSTISNRSSVNRRGTINRSRVNRGSGLSIPRRNIGRTNRGLSRRVYGTRSYHRPRGYKSRSYSSFFHSPYSKRIKSHRSYGKYGYYSLLRSKYKSHLYIKWILSPSKRFNGYYNINNYPFYVHNGYRHRYSNIEYCDYQLVDKYTHTVERNYGNNFCSDSYNSCAYERDRKNNYSQENRYFCAESFDDGFQVDQGIEQEVPTRGNQRTTPRQEETLERDVDVEQVQDVEQDVQVEQIEEEQVVQEDESEECFDLDELTGECFDN